MDTSGLKRGRRSVHWEGPIILFIRTTRRVIRLNPSPYSNAPLGESRLNLAATILSTSSSPAAAVGSKSPCQCARVFPYESNQQLTGNLHEPYFQLPKMQVQCNGTGAPSVFQGFQNRFLHHLVRAVRFGRSARPPSEALASAICAITFSILAVYLFPYIVDLLCLSWWIAQ